MSIWAQGADMGNPGQYGKLYNGGADKRAEFQQCVIVLSGLPLMGKSVLAKTLASCTNIQPFDVDEIRHEIDETRRLDATIRMLSPDKEQATMIRSYTQMCERARLWLITHKQPVILSGTFSRAVFKEPLHNLKDFLEKEGIPLRIFQLVISDIEVERRIRKRQEEERNLSNVATLEKFHWAKSIFTPIPGAMVIDTESSLEECTSRIIVSLDDLRI